MSIGRVPGVTGIQPSIVDAKGDLIVATAADSVDRLAVGSANQVLTVDSSTATGLKWATPAGGGANWSLVNTGGTALTGAQTITVNLSGADKIMILVTGASSVNAGSYILIRLNTDTGNNYNEFGANFLWNSTYAAGNFDGRAQVPTNGFTFGRMSQNAGSTVSGYCLLSGCDAAGVKVANWSGGGTANTSNTHETYIMGGWYASASTISSISLRSTDGNFDAGTVYVYKSA